MEVQPDFRDLLALFNEHKVDYMIVGGYALAFHGVPRYTGDIDIFIKPTSENAKRILLALDEFGFKSVKLTIDDFMNPDTVVQLGVAPVRIDLLTSLTDLSWEEAFLGRVEGKYGDIIVHYLGRKEFIKNKRATGRKRDVADLEELE
jgi:hypothetical protein